MNKPNIAKLVQDGNLSGLIEASGFEGDSSVRLSAISAIADLALKANGKTDISVINTINDATHDHSSEVRTLVMDIIEQLRDKRNIPALKHLIVDHDHSIRKRAIKTLANYNDQSALDILIDMTSSPDKQVKALALSALLSREEPEIIEKVNELIETDDPVIIAKALNYLERSVSERIIDKLITLLDEQSDVRFVASEKLKEIGWQPKTLGEQITFLIAQRRWDEVFGFGLAALSPLVDTLKHQDETLGKVSSMIAEFGPSAVDKVIRMTEEFNDEFRENCAVAFRYMGEPGLERLIIALQNESFLIREFAAMGLRQFGADAISRLIIHLKNPNQDVRELAIALMYDAGWSPQTDTEKAFALIAQKKYEELENMGIDALESLQYALKHFDYKYDLAIVLSKLLDKKAVSQLVRMLEDEDYKEAAEEALVRYGRDALSEIIDYIPEGNIDFRKKASEIFGLINDYESIPALIYLLKDIDKDVRKSAVSAVGEVCENSARCPDDVLKMLFLHLSSPDPEIRCDTIESLVKIRDMRSVEPLSRMLKDPDDGVRKEVIYALTTLKNIGAIGGLEEIFETREDELREMAAHSLNALGYEAKDNDFGAEFFIFNNNTKELVKRGPSVLNMVMEHFYNPKYRPGLKPVIIENGGYAVPHLVEALDKHDNLFYELYDLLVIIERKQREHKKTGSFEISDIHGNIKKLSGHSYFGEYVALTHDCPFCNNQASKGRTLAWIVSGIRKKGYIKFPCNYCGKEISIPEAIFTEEFLKELKKTKDLIGNSFFKKRRVADTLVWNSGTIIHDHNVSGKYATEKESLKDKIAKAKARKTKPTEVVKPKKKEEELKEAFIPIEEPKKKKKSFVVKKDTAPKPQIEKKQVEKQKSAPVKEAPKVEKQEKLPKIKHGNKTFVLKSVALICAEEVPESAIDLLLDTSMEKWNFGNFDPEQDIYIWQFPTDVDFIKECARVIKQDKNHFLDMFKKEIDKDVIQRFIPVGKEMKLWYNLMKVDGVITLVVGFAELT